MFNKQNFCHVASNNRNEKKAGIFVYKTTDDLATVTTNGYFNEKIIDINLHDLIIHEWHNPADRTKVQKNVLCVTERTLDNVGTTLIKSKWEADTDQIVATLQEQVGQIVGNYVTLTTEQTITGKKRFEREIETSSVITIEQYGSLRFYANNRQHITLRFSTPYIEIGNKLTPIKILGNNARPLYNDNSTIALLSDVDLAANSGRMITDQGLWYAKMNSATVAPAAENGTNYADFSQVDGQGNPIIVTYTRTNGAWVQDQTITPPAEYDGYVPITSKIWDIPEQAGQQGGRILWNHQSKEFTPYPQIISFDSANITNSTITSSTFEGSATLANNSTVQMASTPTDDNVASVGYVKAALVGADYVVAFQAPTPENGYTWFRKYASGWVEQGGIKEAAGIQTIQLPVQMANTYYTVLMTDKRNATTRDGNENDQVLYPNCTTTSLYVFINTNCNVYWEVKGMAA